MLSITATKVKAVNSNQDTISYNTVQNYNTNHKFPLTTSLEGSFSWLMGPIVFAGLNFVPMGAIALKILSSIPEKED